MKKVAILQSNYLPWKGVFDMINRVDTFVFLEDVQYTEHDWRNRNKIYTKDGVKWITVPIVNSGLRGQLICDAKIDKRSNWQRKHYNSFSINYAKAPFFSDYKWIIEYLYNDTEWEKISEFNISSISIIAKTLGINTKFVNSVDLNSVGKKDDKVIDICKILDADYYLSGPAAKNYIDMEKFRAANIELSYLTYSYPEYKQLYEPFEHGVTILDLLFNCGKDAPKYIWGNIGDRNE